MKLEDYPVEDLKKAISKIQQKEVEAENKKIKNLLTKADIKKLDKIGWTNTTETQEVTMQVVVEYHVFGGQLIFDKYDDEIGEEIQTEILKRKETKDLLRSERDKKEIFEDAVKELAKKYNTDIETIVNSYERVTGLKYLVYNAHPER